MSLVRSSVSSPPTQTGLDVRLYEQPQRGAFQRCMNPVELLGADNRSRLGRHGGVFTPLPACNVVIWSFSAVVKIAKLQTRESTVRCRTGGTTAWSVDYSAD
jgi:hypothetical protein